MQSTLPTPKDLPLISIVTPSFNQGQFIRETIESVLSQDYANLEYWVIDGKSTDNTVAILQEYEHDPRFHWISEADRGQSDAINKGIARCHGEIFGWLNSDDVFLPRTLAYIAQGWQEINRPAIIYGLARYIDEHGNDLGDCAAQSPTMSLDKLLWIGKHTFIQPATFAPTELIRTLGGVDPNSHYMFDIDLWIRLAEQIPIKFIPHVIALYRLHATSKTVSSSVKFIEDARLVLNNAAQRGTISLSQAHSRSELFALRMYLMPTTINLPTALKSFRLAIAADPSVFLEALLILLKASLRLTLGERFWAWARSLKAKWG